MAGFKTHITTSTVLGVAYGGGAYLWWDMPPAQCLLAGGLCSVSGMLPDLDSGNSVPLRESVAFAAAVAPMLMMDRFRHMGLSTDSMVLLGALIYLAVRFGLGKFLRKFTVHRGMFHSLPAAIICAELAFLLCDCSELSTRFFKAGAVTLGFMSHLLLDELWSIEWKRGRWRLKKSFGTAFKLWSNNFWGNLSTYAKLAMLTYVVVNDPLWMGRLGHPHAAHAENVAGETHDHSTTTPGSPSPRGDPSEKEEPKVVDSWLEFFRR